MAFFETEFPTTLAYRALGGPSFFTTINEAASGYEQRTRNWAVSRGKWTVSLITPPEFGTNRQGFIDLLLAFFLAVGGRADAFRLKDHKDFQARAQTIGTGDGHTTTFQLSKTYKTGIQTYVRAVRKPIASPAIDYKGAALANTVKVYLNGVLQSSGWSVDGTTGIVTFTSAPGSGVAVTVDFDFHYPVRFDTDELMLAIEESNVANGALISAPSLVLMEVRLT